MQVGRHGGFAVMVGTPAPRTAGHEHGASESIPRGDLGHGAETDRWVKSVRPPGARGSGCTIARPCHTPAPDDAGRQQRAGVIHSNRYLGDHPQVAMATVEFHRWEQHLVVIILAPALDATGRQHGAGTIAYEASRDLCNAAGCPQVVVVCDRAISQFGQRQPTVPDCGFKRYRKQRVQLHVRPETCSASPVKY